MSTREPAEWPIGERREVQSDVNGEKQLVCQHLSGTSEDEEAWRIGLHPSRVDWLHPHSAFLDGKGEPIDRSVPGE